MKFETQIPGVELDFDRSTITLNWQSFPAVAVSMGQPLACPFDESAKDAACRYDCRKGGPCVFGGAHSLDGDWSQGWAVYVPMENEALLCLDMGNYSVPTVPRQRRTVQHDWGIGVTLVSRWVTRSISGDLCPEILSVKDDIITNNLPNSVGSFYWDRAEPGWIAELIQRMGRKRVEASIPTGAIEGRLLPIGKLSERPHPTDTISP
jgi:hypothetical protein